MLGFTALLAAASATMVSAAAIAPRDAGEAFITPHEQFSSSAGVLGCKVNTNRVAYWPSAVSCNDICVKVSHGGRSVYLIKIDQSGGAHDISYDAWNYLLYGTSATKDPHTGGGQPMNYEFVHPSKCAHLLDDDGKVPLTAPNAMNFLNSCLDQPKSYVAQNHILYNIYDTNCKYGYNEVCTLNRAVSNQPSCPHTLGDNVTLNIANKVKNIIYGTGAVVAA